MHKSQLIFLVAGVGYLGFNLSEIYRRRGFEVIILTRERSISKRPYIIKKLLDLGVKFEIFPSILPNHVKQLIDKYGVPYLIYYLAGTNKGSIGNMRYIHGNLSYKMLKDLVDRGVDGFNYIHVSAYNPGKIVSGYIESKVYGEKLLDKVEVKDDINVYVIRPGLLVGKYPYHPEWLMMYEISRHGFIVETNSKTAFTPIKEIPDIIDFLITRNIDVDKPIDITPYHEDIGVITRYFNEFFGHVETHKLSLHLPKWLWKLMPYQGMLGFIRGFIYKHTPPKSRMLIEHGYRFKSRLRDVLRDAFITLNEMNKTLNPYYQFIRMTFS